MSTILVGVDSGDSSTRAVEFAVEATRGADVDLVIAHVIHWSPFTFNTPTDNEERPRKRAEEIEHARVTVVGPMVALAEESGHRIRSEIRHGNPARTLIALATTSAGLLAVFPFLTHCLQRYAQVVDSITDAEHRASTLRLLPQTPEHRNPEDPT